MPSNIQQATKSLASITCVSLGGIIANLPEVKGYFEILSLGLGCLGSIFFMASVIKHWNDKGDKTDKE